MAEAATANPIPHARLPTGPPISSITHRVFHPPKLERKHSSGDLHSRLKTRKILGVGEIDNGDIHRSKISQLLGHNEHLYVKFPRGFWMWHLLSAVIFTVQGFWSLLFPGYFFTLPDPPVPEMYLAVRLYGSASLALALCLWMMVPKIQCSYSVASVSAFLWHFQGTMDKAQARCALMAIILYQVLHIIVCCFSMETWELTNLTWTGSLGTLICLMVNASYYHAIGRSTSGLRKSSSYKDLVTGTIKEGDKKDK